MKHMAQHSFRIPLTSSVRTRLTLWYLAVMALIIVLFDGGLYASQAFLNSATTENTLETPLYQDSQHLEGAYNEALQADLKPATLRLTLSSQEMVLLLSPDGRVLDSRGPLTSSLIQQLQIKAGQGAQITDLSVPQNHAHGWWNQDDTYRVLITPVLDQNTRI